MAQNIYNNKEFFNGYATLRRSVEGLAGAPEWTNITQMLPNIEAMNVVDLGCGYGWFCRYAKEKGAKRVLGLDLSEKMLERARHLTNDTDIVYRQQDLESLQLEENAYDLVYSSLTLHYIEDLSRLFRNIYDSLKKGGHFVFSAEHPIYTASKNPEKDWMVDNQGNKCWPVSSFSYEGKRETNFFVKGVIKEHRKLSTYINLLIEAGFHMKHLDEFGPTQEQIDEKPFLAEEVERPMIFLCSVVKN